ncbi:peroxiredoxin family protein [Halobacillus andaensis]|uniref:peroxiredoxin family protein n=1 Tax=Halobacillus andaensis TaxID=1176239 RepID=UPI003D741BEE
MFFFRGSWCPICLDELEKLEKEKERLANHNLKLTAISSDNLDDLKKMVIKHHFTFPILSDEFATVLEAFGVYLHRLNAPYEDNGVHGEPAYFLINEEGKLLYQHKQTGPFGRPSIESLVKTTKYIATRLKG